MKAFPKGKDKRSTCPLCGFSLESYDRAPRCLRLGSILKERYLIGRVLGEGSFGITYIGRDMLLDQIVAIKEYFPINHVSRDMLEEESDAGNTVYVYAGDEEESYKNGLEKFYNEAKILAKFHGIAGVVSVINFFYINFFTVIQFFKSFNIFFKRLVKIQPRIKNYESWLIIKYF
jgi:serine/threonine protein kinase